VGSCNPLTEKTITSTLKQQLLPSCYYKEGWYVTGVPRFGNAGLTTTTQ